MPDWSAATPHVPVASSVIVVPFVPLAVQTVGVVDENVTGRPDDAVPLTVIGDSTSVLAPGLTNVMVCVALVIANVRVIDGAAAYEPLPGWLATTEQEPGATNVIVAPFGPLEVQAAGVVVVNVTARPDVAVALTASGDWAIVFPVMLANVMLWVPSDTLNDRGLSGAGSYVALPA